MSVVKIAQSICQRLITQEINGPKRKAANALEMLVGAAYAAAALGHDKEAAALTYTACLVSVRGVVALEEVASREIVVDTTDKEA
jgi:hypothetical protein